MAESIRYFQSIAGLATRLLPRKKHQPHQINDNIGIIPLYESDNAAIDICFVHGLNGDRMGTWKWTTPDHEETNVWPQDFLGQDAQADHLDVRILSYGYRSLAPTSEFLTQRTLYRHSQQLLSVLAAVRKDCSERPLIFVGHSLGGIVIKSALIFSSQAKGPDLLALSVSTTGIVFLGTPHTEAMSSLDQSKWPKMLATIVELSGFGNDSLVKHLDRQSLSLQSRLQPFKALSENISIVSFYEKIQPSAKNIIVPKPATGSPYGDRVHTIHADHLNMCKFSSREAPDYQKVSHEILRLCHEANERLQKNWEKYEINKCEERISRKYMERVLSTDTEEQLPNNMALDDFRIEDFPLQPRNKGFHGRTEELEFLHKTLLKRCSPSHANPCSTVNLFGPGGMGKTEIAQEFAYTFRDRFTSIFWIPGASRQSIEQGFVNIARILRQQLHRPTSVTALRILPDLPPGVELDEFQLRSTINAVLEWFQSTENPGWLVIVDDLELEGDHDIINLIPRTTCVHGHCIITSRRPVDWNFIHTYPVRPFSPDESFSFLQRSTGLSDASEHDVATLSKSLKYIPMALDAAASYMTSTQITLHKYMQLFQSPADTEEERPATSLETELTRIENLLLNTMNNVPDTDRLRKTLSLGILEVCCVLSMESVCLSIFLSQSFKNKYPGNTMSAIKELERNCLVALTEDERYLISQKVVLDHSLRLLSDDQRIHASQVACESTLSAAQSLQQLRDEEKSVDTSFAECDLAAVMSRCYQLIKDNIPSSNEWDIDLEMMGQVCERQGEIGDAINFYNLLVSRNEGAAPVLRRIKMRLAKTRRISGDDIRAESLCEELIQPKEDILSTSATSTQQERPLGDEVDLEALRLLKKLAHEKSSPEDELAISKQIATMQEYRLGHMHPGTLEAVQQLSRDLVEVGFYDEAEANMRRVLLSYENMSGASYVKTTEAFEVLASIRLKQGKYDDAKDFFNRALHNHLARLGRNHPTTQKCWSQLGQVYDMQKSYAKASEVYDKCLAILTVTLGIDHPDVLRVRSYKAANLTNRDLYDEAEKELSGVLDIMETHKDIHHENDKRRTALQLVEIMRRNPRADDEAWLEKKVHDLEIEHNIDLHRRIGWIY